MRILSVNNSADVYGASRCLERVFTRIVRAGHQVTVIVPCDGPLVPLLRRGGVTVIFHPALAVIDRPTMRSAGGVARLLVRWPLSSLWLAGLILRKRIDLVHTNTAVMPSPAIAAMLTGRPHVWHVREFFGEFGSLWKVYQSYLCRLSTTVVAVSAAVAKQFDTRFAAKMTIVYDGLSPAKEDEPQPETASSLRERFSLHEGLLIGVIGRIKWVRKGQEIALEAFARLAEKYPDARLVIIGSAAVGNEEHLLKLVQLGETRGVAERITYTGDLEVTLDTYKSLDITIVPSVQAEPFGCVVMESMAAGTVVIGSDNGGIAEQIIDGESGRLFTPGDPEALAECLDQLLGDEALRARLARGGRARFLSMFAIDLTVSSMLAIFERAINSSAQALTLASEPERH